MGLCGFKCEKCALRERCGGCSMCEASICGNKCNGCGVICIKNGPSLIKINKDIGNMNESKLRDNYKYKLPHHIPVIPDRIEGLEFENSFIGIHGSNFMSASGEKVRKIYDTRGFHGALNINKSCKGLLQFYVKDRTLEGMWENRIGVINDLKKAKLDCIIAPNFSVYEDAPRVDHLYNINRSIQFYNSMIDAGLNAIPDVSWYNDSDLDYWIDLINKSNVRTIGFSFQVVDVRLKASNLWKHYLAGFRYMLNQIDKELDVVIVGASSENKAREIRMAAPGRFKLHYINQAAYIQSQRGMISEGRVRDISISREKLLKKNIDYFNKLYKEINEGGI